MERKEIAALLSLSALWGGSFGFMRVGAPAFGPILLIFLRVLLAGLALLTYSLLARRLPPLRPYWRHYLVIGAINSALPFCLISAAELHLPASLAATLNATTPLFGLLLAGAPLTMRKTAGLLLGLGGVVVLVGLGPLPLTTQTLWSMGASLLAALSYGAAATYTRAKLPDGEPLALALYSQLFAAALLLPLVPFVLPAAAPSALAVGSVVALGLLCTALAYLLYFYLIIHAGATRATLVTYLSPAFGLLWGALFLQERVGPAALTGFGLILLSVGLVSRKEAAAHGVRR